MIDLANLVRRKPASTNQNVELETSTAAVNKTSPSGGSALSLLSGYDDSDSHSDSD